MSSISSAYSPLQQLQAQLQSSVSTGAIKSADQSTLADALTSIDSSITTSRDTDTAQGKPGDLKAKVDGLIAAQVSSGKLSSDQATELKGVFEDTFGGGPGGPEGPGGPGGPGGPDGPPPSDSADASDETDDTDETTDITDVLAQFLKTLQATLTDSTSSSYSAAGSKNSTSQIASLLFDYTS